MKTLVNNKIYEVPTDQVNLQSAYSGDYIYYLPEISRWVRCPNYEQTPQVTPGKFVSQERVLELLSGSVLNAEQCSFLGKLGTLSVTAGVYDTSASYLICDGQAHRTRVSELLYASEPEASNPDAVLTELWGTPDGTFSIIAYVDIGNHRDLATPISQQGAREYLEGRMLSPTEFEKCLKLGLFTEHTEEK